jgi:O-antigen/teichoic acid export membrane protein
MSLLNGTPQPEPSGSAPAGARELRRRLVLFFLPGALQLILAFVTLPLTTMRLGPADFAAFSLVVSMSALAMSLSQMGSGYLLTHRYRGAPFTEQCSMVTAMTLLVLSCSVVFAAGFVIAFVLLHGAWSFTAGITVTMVVLVALESIGSALFTLALNLSKLGTSTGFYAALSIVRSVVAAIVTLAALFLLDLHGLSLFVGHVCGGVVVFVGSLVMMSRFFVPHLDWEALRYALSLGGWSTVSLLFLQGRQTVERALLSRYLGLYDLGIYTHAQQYQSFAMLGTQPIHSAATVVFLDEAKEPSRRFGRTARIADVLFLGVTVFGVAAALFGRAVIGLLTHGKFDAAGPYVALLVGVVLVQISGRPQYAELIAHGRGRYLSVCNVIAAVGSVATLVALVHSFGLLAAVVASYVQFLLFRVATGIDPFSTARLPFQDQGAVLGLLVIVLTVAGVEYFEPNLLVRAVILLAFLAAVLVFARPTVTDVALQIRDHFRRGRPAAKPPLASAALAPAAVAPTGAADVGSARG